MLLYSKEPSQCGQFKQIELPKSVLCRGMVCQKFNKRNCRDVVNALCKNGAFSNSVDPDKMPQNAESHQGLRYML